MRISSEERLRLGAVLLLAAVILFGQLESEVLYSVDGIVYAVVGQELADRPWWQWAYLTWKGGPFIEHPPLTPWLLALSFRLFGESTLSALLVPSFLSWLTVGLTYLWGRRLKDETTGLLAALALILTPQFIKAGRNPMLEPALQLGIAASAYAFLRARQTARLHYAALSGLALALAVLAKGPPALLALGLSLVAWRFNPQPAARRLHEGKFWLLYSAAALIPLVLFDVWSMTLGHGSFWSAYFGHQLQYTVVHGRGHTDFNPTFYLRILFVEYQPWIWVVLAAFPSLCFRRLPNLKPVAFVGLAWVLGALLPFTLMRHKAPWYIQIYYPGLALLAAATLQAWLPTARTLVWIPRVAFGLAIPVVLLSSTAPSLFQGYGRTGEWFLEGAKTSLGRSLEGQNVSDCLGLGEWRGQFFYRFYLRAQNLDCQDPKAAYRVIHREQLSAGGKYRVRYVREPWLLVERNP